VSLNSFQFVKRSDEGAYGTVVLATGSLVCAPERLYAIKVMKKRLMTSSSMSDVFAERNALNADNWSSFCHNSLRLLPK
jgi:hypothetical protein